MGTATGLAPLKQTFRARVALTAAGTDDEEVLFVAPYTGAVTAVRYNPDAAITGATATATTLAVRNRGAAGAGTTVMASIAFITGTNAVAFDETTVPLHATVANRDAVAGDVITFQKTHASTGTATPDAEVEVDFSRD